MAPGTSNLPTTQPLTIRYARFTNPMRLDIALLPGQRPFPLILSLSKDERGDTAL